MMRAMMRPIEAQMPMVASPGRTTMMNTPRVIRPIVSDRAALRPCLSEYRPMRMAPNGRTTKVMAKVAQVISCADRPSPG